MKDTVRLKIGAGITIVWLVVMVVFLIAYKRPDELNEWGDFFAGFFAPLAFLWLVLGYMQQGEELRNSTRALKLQAAELRASVEQQSRLVELSRQQLEQEMDTVRFERQRLKPRFMLSLKNFVEAQDGFGYTLTIFNAGNTATNIEIEIRPPSPLSPYMRFEVLPTHKSMEFGAAYHKGRGPISEVCIRYIDTAGHPGSALFKAIRPDGSKRVEFKEVAAVDEAFRDAMEDST